MTVNYDVKLIRIKDLTSFLASYVKNMDKDDFLPITPHKAESIINNPCANDDDVALVLVFCNKKCIGYLGLIVNRLLIKGERIRVNWMSAWYITPEFQGKGIGSLLINEIKKVDMPICSIHPITGAYKKNGFTKLPELKFKEINFEKFNLLSRALSFFFSKNMTNSIFLRTLIKLSDSFYTPIRKSIMWLANRSLSEKMEVSNIVFKEVDQIREVEANRQVDGFYRSMDSVNIMLKYPWVKEWDDLLSKKYHFSHSSSLFRYIVYEIFDVSSDKEKYLGATVYLVAKRNDKIVIRVCDYFGNNIEKLIAPKTIELAREYNANSVVCSKDLFGEGVNWIDLHVYEHTRESVYYKDSYSNYKVLNFEAINVRFSDGDQNYY